MRILIDECVDPRIKRLFPPHEVWTVHDMGWDALQDGPLLILAQKHFDVFVTIDRNLEFQQSLTTYSLGFVVISVPKNQMPFYEKLRNQILQAVKVVKPGEVTRVVWTES